MHTYGGAVLCYVKNVKFYWNIFCKHNFYFMTTVPHIQCKNIIFANFIAYSFNIPYYTAKAGNKTEQAQYCLHNGCFSLDVACHCYSPSFIIFMILGEYACRHACMCVNSVEFFICHEMTR